MSRPSRRLAVLPFLLVAALGGIPAAALPPPTRQLESLPLDVQRAVARREGLPLPTAPDAWCRSGDELEEWLRLRAEAPWDRSRVRRNKAAVQFVDGIILMEDDGSLTRNDRLVDVAGKTLELIPTGGGHAIVEQPLQYETGPETDLFVDFFQWSGVGVDLTQFTFPFGGQSYTRIWVTSDFGLTFGQQPPTAPQADSLCGRGCWLRKSEIIANRAPRVSPLQHGTNLYGWTATYREEPDRVVFNWRANDGGPIDVDVQAVLYSDGRIRFNYANVQGVDWGAPTVVTGNDAWWNDLRPAGAVTDPAGDVALPGPDGPALDLLSVTADQVADSEVIQVDLTVAAQRSVNPGDRMYYAITLRDEPTDPEALGTVYFVWDWFGWRWTTQYLSDLGTTLRFHLFQSELGLSDGDLTLEVSTFYGAAPFQPGDDARLEINFTPNTSSLMLDLSDDLPAVVEGPPLFEAFSLPELVPAAVHETLVGSLDQLTNLPPLEGVGIYQNFDTDIVFYAGGYSTAGTPAADGIGRGSSADPETPALLHLNTIYSYGWLDWAMTVLTHELGHRWLTHFRVDDGSGAQRLMNPVSGHPAAWVHLPAVAPVYRPNDFSCMGGSNWTDHGNGTFTSEPTQTGYSSGFHWHEMYVLGLAAPTEVPDWWYIQNSNPSVPDQYWPQPGVTVSGTRVPMSISDLVAAEGPRFPAYPNARSDFLTPLVLVVRPGEYDQAEIDTVEALCDEWTTVWHDATAQRSTMRCAFHPPDVIITNPPNTVVIPPGTTLGLTGQGTDADNDAVNLAWTFAGLAPDATGPGPHDVTFVNEGIYEVELSGVDATGMPTTTPATRTIIVDCTTTTPPDEVGLLMVRRDGPTDLLFTWSDLPTNPTDYLMVSSVSAPGPFQALGASPSGTTGLVAPMPTVNTFYKVAARYTPGCLGPL